MWMPRRVGLEAVGLTGKNGKSETERKNDDVDFLATGSKPPTHRGAALMTKRQESSSILQSLCVAAAILWGSSAAYPAESKDAASGAIGRVEQMPSLPRPFALRDWRQVTRDYLDFVFDFDKRGSHLPLVRWEDNGKTMIWMPAYVGGKDGTESINYLAAIVSGSLVGLDMRTYRGHDWVAIGTNFYNPADGVFLDGLKAQSGGSFWYDVFPNVLFCQLTELYPDEAGLQQRMLSVADRWYQACVALGGRVNPPALPSFDHTGFNLRTMRPFDNGERIEPEGAAGIAWLEYMAWQKSKDPRFLVAADWSIRALEGKPIEANPLYEVLLPYAALTAARMNAELGRNYDLARLVNWCFDPRPSPEARPNWGVIIGSWSGLDVNGLVGSVTDGGGYAFAMNTFQYVGTLAPVARYDPRYAHDIGKWILNVASASRLFYSNAHDAEHQSSFAWSSTHDPESVIAYEGLRRWKRSAASVARADYSEAAGKVLQGSFISTHYYREDPPQMEVLEETPVGDSARLNHTWEFDLPDCPERFLVVAAQREDHGHHGNYFRFSCSSNPEGPFTEAFCVTNSDPPRVKELPSNLRGKLYVKAESHDHSRGQTACDQLRVDAMAISCRSDIGPYAQGDLIVSFIDLVKNYTVPIVLYRPAQVVTDLGLYGSAHVGNLGGIIKPTNIERILRLDLLKTDYFHRPAYPTFLYYNPYPTPKEVEVDLGVEPKDVYDIVSKAFLLRTAGGSAKIMIPPDTARVLALAPASGKLTREGTHTLINGVVVDYKN